MPVSKSPFKAPPGAVAKVSIIDSTMRLHGMAARHLCTPPVEGWETFSAVPTWSFLIESSTGKKALFDLGLHKDVAKYVPNTQNNIKKFGWDPQVKEHVAEIIKRHGVDPQEIDSIIWSHYHFDHIGDTTTFPSSTELVVGPGFKDAVGPGYPTRPDAPVTEEDIGGREVREVSFPENGLRAGAFPALDFFGDGSFYLLDTPGHCVGHIGGLARTSSGGDSAADTFIMMGGDLCHHGGEIRPSPWLQLPETFGGRPAAAFRELNVKQARSPDGPFIDPALNLDVKLAFETIARAQEADADPNVWFVFAHDTALLEDVDLFPEKANAWKEKGWKESTRWKFLEDFLPAVGGKIHQ